MEEFVQLASKQLGLGSDQARSATSGLLAFLQKEAGGSEVRNLLSKLPGAEALAGEAAQAESGGGGLMGAVSGLTGGRLGSSMGLLSTLQGAGLDSGGASRFLGLFFDFAKQKAGTDVVDGLLSKLPEIRKLIG